MLIRKPAVAVSLAAAALACAPVVHATDVPAPNVLPGACTDQSPPTSGYTSRAAKSAKRSHVLRGTASDVGCGVDRVQISMGRRVGKKCNYLARSSKLSRHAASCARPTVWLPTTGTPSWSFRLPKKLARGTYIVRTRATDFAGNVQRVRSHK